jgi:hypothetical protein
MKNAFLSLFVFLSIANTLWSQIVDIEDYQAKINRAELAYIEGKKDESLKLYYELLLTSKGNFCKDIHNALIVAAELNDRDKFFELLQLILVKGLSNQKMNSIEPFESFRSDPRWQKFLDKNAEYICPNPTLRAAIDSIAFIDQYFRKLEGSYEVYGDTIRKIDSLNMNFIYGLVESNTFPGENEIGVRAASCYQEYDIVFHHYTQSTSLDENKQKITPIIVNLVRQGLVSPNRACLWLDMQQGEFKSGVFDICNYNVNGKITSYYYPDYLYRTKILIDEYRKWIYAEPIEDYYRKVAFKINNPSNKLIFDIKLNTFFCNENEFIRWTKGMVEIK